MGNPAQERGTETAKRALSKSGRARPSFLVRPADEHEFSGDESSSTESVTASGADGPQKQVLGEISHELRAPISRIKILIERARQCPQQIPNYLGRIEENVLRMQALTQRLLDFSRLETVEEPLVKEPCDLAQLVSRVVEDARIEAEARRCSIKLLLVPGCLVAARYELLYGALENVVRNSVQHTKEGSSVSVVLSRPSGRRAEILVEDEGPGISEGELQEVFKPFYRAAHTRGSGTGLGLAISERTIKLHRGSICARNRSDRTGLQVTIQIPLHP